VKVKVLTSLAAGLPCVMTPIAAEGLELPQALAPLVQERPAGIAGALRRLCADQPWNAAMRDAGMAFVRARFGSAATDVALQPLCRHSKTQR
jgi:glycosyltransferase involved in cell wall biosynthesis